MMPTHGRGPFRRFVLGSVTAKVLHDAPCPVWTSAHLDENSTPMPSNLSNILCAVDLDDTGSILSVMPGISRAGWVSNLPSRTQFQR